MPDYKVGIQESKETHAEAAAWKSPKTRKRLPDLFFDSKDGNLNNNLHEVNGMSFSEKVMLHESAHTLAPVSELPWTQHPPAAGAWLRSGSNVVTTAAKTRLARQSCPGWPRLPPNPPARTSHLATIAAPLEQESLTRMLWPRLTAGLWSATGWWPTAVPVAHWKSLEFLSPPLCAHPCAIGAAGVVAVMLTGVGWSE